MRRRKRLERRVCDDDCQHGRVAVELLLVLLLFIIVFFFIVIIVLELEQQLVGQCGHRSGGLRSDLSGLQW